MSILFAEVLSEHACAVYFEIIILTAILWYFITWLFAVPFCDVAVGSQAP